MSPLPETSALPAKDASLTAGPASVSQQASTKAHKAVDHFSEGAHRVINSLESTAATIEPQGRRVVSGAQSYVRANPLLSLGIAVAAGMLVRHLVRR